MARASVGDVISHWHHLLENLQASPLEFYKSDLWGPGGQLAAASAGAGHGGRCGVSEHPNPATTEHLKTGHFG